MYCVCVCVCIRASVIFRAVCRGLVKNAVWKVLGNTFVPNNVKGRSVLFRRVLVENIWIYFFLRYRKYSAKNNNIRIAYVFFKTSRTAIGHKRTYLNFNELFKRIQIHAELIIISNDNYTSDDSLYIYIHICYVNGIEQIDRFPMAWISKNHNVQQWTECFYYFFFFLIVFCIR